MGIASHSLCSGGKLSNAASCSCLYRMLHKRHSISYKVPAMVYVYAVVLTLVNLLCWVGIVFGLPGTWLMILLPVLLKWWQPDQFLVSWTVLGVAVGLAVLGEVFEFVLGAVGSRRTGGSTRGAVLALVGSLVGGVMGIALPVPVVGPLLGACFGAFVGALLGNLWAGRTLFQSFAAGRGAALGQFWGTVAKLAIGAIIAIMLAIAAFV
jgi:uncharacterized protein